MVEPFRSVIMLLPSTPSNPKYNEFLDESRRLSYLHPFYAPKPPFPELKLQVRSREINCIGLPSSVLCPLAGSRVQGATPLHPWLPPSVHGIYSPTPASSIRLPCKS